MHVKHITHTFTSYSQKAREKMGLPPWHGQQQMPLGVKAGFEGPPTSLLSHRFPRKIMTIFENRLYVSARLKLFPGDVYPD